MSDDHAKPPVGSASLDPQTTADWDALRQQGHQMLDTLLDSLQTLRERPVWQPPTETACAAFRDTLPETPADPAALLETVREHILPYTVGNTHPGFMGWVHGGGTPVGMLAELIAGGLNVNVGGRNQIPVHVERQVIRWVQEMAGFPDTASGVLVTGSSLANFIALLVARTSCLGQSVRTQGLPTDQRLVAYTSTSAHGCIAQAMELAGLGSQWLRRMPTDANYAMDVAALRTQIATDRADGLIPFFVAGTAGTVDTGAIDDLAALADLCATEKLWFHVDGAYGALAKLAPALAPRLAGLERADSLAFDFHKWGQVPYDAGCVLIRDAQQHLATFSAPAAYLRRETEGMAGGSPWPCDFGPDLSRGFRALKVWMTFKAYGSERLGEVVAHTCRLATQLGQQIDAEPRLQRMAPVSLNIVCFRYVGSGQLDDVTLDTLNNELLIALQISGIAAPSSTTLNGRFVLRAALVNHRTDARDTDALLSAVLSLGQTLETAALQKNHP